jgi:hypothetical protein
VWQALAQFRGLKHLRLVARIGDLHRLDEFALDALTKFEGCRGLRALAISQSFELEIRTNCCGSTVYKDKKLQIGYQLISDRRIAFEERYKQCEEELRRALLKQ